MAKCPICNSRKGKRKCKAADSFICSLCRGETRSMEVDEILSLDDYYHDSRFESKKPNLRGSWKERAGDNFYSRGPDGIWIQVAARFTPGVNDVPNDNPDTIG